MHTKDLDEIVENITRGRKAELVTTAQRREILTHYGVKFIHRGSFYHKKFRNCKGGVWLFYAVDQKEGKRLNEIPKEYKQTGLI